MPTENNPRVVFERLFGEGGSPERRTAQARRTRSILDSVLEDLGRLQKRLGPGDQTRVTDYVDSVREVERRIQGVETRADVELPTLVRPSGIPERFDEHVGLMYELQWLAFRADLTRVVTFMLGRDLNFRTYPEVGVTEGHHGLSHHGDRPEQILKYSRVGTLQAQLFASFLKQLQDTPDGDGSLLDHSTFLYGAGLSNPNTHSHTNLPLTIVGGSGAAPGRPSSGVPARHADDQPAVDAARRRRCARRAARRQHRTAPSPTGGVGHMQGRSGGVAMRVRRELARRGWAPTLLVLVLGLGVTGRELTLVEAVKAGNGAAARALLAQKVDVNLASPDGATALHWAAELDDLPMVEALLAAGARARVANRNGVTPLHLAATNGSATVVERLLAGGADPNAALPGGETVLMTAARTGGPDAIRALVAGGANVNAKETQKGQTPLMWAAAENNAAAIAVLAGAGADIYAVSLGKFTPLLFAVRGGHIDATGALLDAGVSVDERMADGMSALVLAVYNAHFELAGFLLERGANPNAAAQGWTALHQVAWSRRPNRGFNLPGAVPTGRLDSLELVRRLVARGGDVNARMTKEPRDGNRNMVNRVGSTPFLMAAKATDVPLMKVLLESGADPKLKANDGTSAIMMAAGVGVYGPGESPGNAEEALAAVKLAHEVGGGDVNDANRDGETALHGAVYRGGAVPVLQFLADKGAKLDVYNRKKWTPLFAAEGVVYASSGIRRYPEAAALLRKLMNERGIQVDQSGRITSLGGGAAAGPSAAVVTPVASHTNWDGIYTDEQATRGRQVYARACSHCHLDSLRGDSVSPTLLGPSFFARFPDATALDLVSAIRSTMPQNAPDSLGDQAYVDLVSYLLKANGAGPGAAELKADATALESILITDQPRAR